MRQFQNEIENLPDRLLNIYLSNIDNKTREIIVLKYSSKKMKYKVSKKDFLIEYFQHRFRPSSREKKF